MLHLAEQHPTAAIIINHDVERAAAKVIQQRYPTLEIKPSTTIQEIVWGGFDSLSRHRCFNELAQPWQVGTVQKVHLPNPKVQQFRHSPMEEILNAFLTKQAVLWIIEDPESLPN